MEDVLINVDSEYRNIQTNPSESQFTYNLQTQLKNITSVRLASIEITNSINIVSSTKNNNYFRIYLPNKTNDNDGWLIELPDGLTQSTFQFKVAFDNIFNSLFNSWYALQGFQFQTAYFAEKYLYIFYLNDNITLNFDFNNLSPEENLPTSLATKLTITAGWASLYGIVLQIKNYIQTNYNNRVSYLKTNPNIPSIDLDIGNFSYDAFNINVFDRRFRSNPMSVIPGPAPDCVRIDGIPNNVYTGNDITTNLSALKENIYKVYINDTETFNTSFEVQPDNGILDNLCSNNYMIPNGYLLAGEMLQSASIYYLNNSTNIDDNYSVNIYNLKLQINPQILLISFVNSFDSNDNPINTPATGVKPFLYYFVNSTAQSWDVMDTFGKPKNTVNDLLDTSYLFENNYITYEQYRDPSYVPTLIKDIASLDIDFAPNENKYTNPVSNGMVDINKLGYNMLGYYLGFRENINSTNQPFLLSSVINGVKSVLQATKISQTNGSNYLFLRINDWGVFDFFGRRVYAKILLPSFIDTNAYGQYIIGNSTINSTFIFRQPQNIKRLDIELLDYLGNQVDLNGTNWSMTLQFTEEYNSDSKVMIERDTLVFKNMPKKK
jgi:hypothetical protein